MEERERELFKKAWLFLASETAAGRGVQIRAFPPALVLRLYGSFEDLAAAIPGE